jgi:hypothetical protein
MEQGSVGQGKSEVNGVEDLLGQGQRLVESLQGLVRVAKRP